MRPCAASRTRAPHRRRQRPILVDDRPEVGAVEQLHRDVRPVVEAAGRKDLDDVGMTDRRDGAPLAHEALPQLGAIAMLLREDLDRDLAIEARVDAFEDLAHGARAELSLDAISTKDRPRRRVRHGVILSNLGRLRALARAKPSRRAGLCRSVDHDIRQSRSARDEQDRRCTGSLSSMTSRPGAPQCDLRGRRAVDGRVRLRID